MHPIDLTPEGVARSLDRHRLIRDLNDIALSLRTGDPEIALRRLVNTAGALALNLGHDGYTTHRFDLQPVQREGR